MGSANERRRYIVTSSFFGRAHTQNELLAEKSSKVRSRTYVGTNMDITVLVDVLKTDSSLLTKTLRIY